MHSYDKPLPSKSHGDGYAPAASAAQTSSPQAPIICVFDVSHATFFTADFVLITPLPLLIPYAANGNSITPITYKVQLSPPPNNLATMINNQK
jgi:hypothetical protein